MRLEVKQWGNSKAIRLPKDIVTSIGVSVGDFVELEQVGDDKLIIEIIPNQPKKERVKRPRLTLQQRLAMLDGEELPVLKDWDTMAAVGKEVI